MASIEDMEAFGMLERLVSTSRVERLSVTHIDHGATRSYSPVVFWICIMKTISSRLSLTARVIERKANFKEVKLWQQELCSVEEDRSAIFK
ncbi:MAG: hypothetical protein WCB79_11055 [Halobacteriota archaeon]